VAGCAAIFLASASAAQTPAAPEHDHATANTTSPPADMAAKHRAMMAEREKFAADMKAADERLNALVVKMNAANGARKVAATASVVTELVAQRQGMRDRMMKMQDGMMAHMMEHMQGGAGTTSMCPMMAPGGSANH
jgi:hypothetical protein